MTYACACTALRKASRAVTRRYDEALSPYGLTTVQFAILRTLSRLGETPLSPLAEEMVMDRTSLYRTLKPMAAAGWVAVGDGAGRAKLAALTPQGAALLEKAVPDWRRTQAEFEARMGPGTWAALQAGITAALNAVQS